MTIEKLKKNIYEMFKLDQFLRLNTKTKIDPDDLMPKEYEPDKFRDTFLQVLPNILIYLIDAVHKDKLKTIFSTHNINKELIGEECMKELWVLIMHQDLEIQEYARENMLFDETETMKLEDRILINKGKPQKHNTHNFK